jgi:hypothetical protein
VTTSRLSLRQTRPHARQRRTLSVSPSRRSESRTRKRAPQLGQHTAAQRLDGAFGDDFEVTGAILAAFPGCVVMVTAPPPTGQICDPCDAFFGTNRAAAFAVRVN